jgi:hypothetical protein
LLCRKKKSFDLAKYCVAIKMTDEAKLALHDMFFSYLIQSADAMDSTTKALASDPLQASQVNLLSDSLDSAKILLTKVSNHPFL